MSLQQNGSENGTNGTPITAANSGGGSDTKFDVVTPASGGTITYDTAAAFHGTLGQNHTSTGSGSAAVSWISGINTPAIAARFYYNPGPVLPGALERLLDIRSSGTAARINMTVTNQLAVQDTAGITKLTSATALSVNTWYRIELAISISATNATIQYDYYLGDSVTPADPGFATTTGNTGTSNITLVTFGSAAATTYTGTFYMDDLAINTGTTAYIGPLPVAAMPWIEA